MAVVCSIGKKTLAFFLVALNTGDSLLRHTPLYSEFFLLGLVGRSLGVGDNGACRNQASDPLHQGHNANIPFHHTPPWRKSHRDGPAWRPACWECRGDSGGNINGRSYKFLPSGSLFAGALFPLFHIASSGNSIPRWQ